RIKKSLTQKKLAKRLNISQGYISQLENNTYYNLNPRINFIIVLSRTLDICPLRLIIELTNSCSKCKLNCPFNSNN
ncbi:helix-turn-helix domain-containing protein, partial [Clostridium butyricum]